MSKIDYTYQNLDLREITQNEKSISQNQAPAYKNGKDPIHIKESKRGTFTKAAKSHKASVQGFASKVLNALKGKYSAAMKKKAVFAQNAAKFKH